MGGVNIVTEVAMAVEAGTTTSANEVVVSLPTPVNDMTHTSRH